MRVQIHCSRVKNFEGSFFLEFFKRYLPDIALFFKLNLSYKMYLSETAACYFLDHWRILVPSNVMCQISCVKCHVSQVTCYVSHILCHRLHVTFHQHHKPLPISGRTSSTKILQPSPIKQLHQVDRKQRNIHINNDLQTEKAQEPIQ